VVDLMFIFIIGAVLVLMVAGTLRQRARRRALVAYMHEVERHPDLGTSDTTGAAASLTNVDAAVRLANAQPLGGALSIRTGMDASSSS